MTNTCALTEPKFASNLSYGYVKYLAEQKCKFSTQI